MKEHETLKSNYANGWRDAVLGRKEPYDDNDHGTHVMGTIVGQKGIGVAPGAKWIACKALTAEGKGLESRLNKCAQFVLNFEPKPNVVCNSWGRRGGNMKFFKDEIRLLLVDAGIIPVFAIGNTGPDCNTAEEPGDQSNVISVGAVDENDQIANFSSRGFAHGTKRIKQEVCAPGVGIRAAFIPDRNSYKKLPGTSMAAPHVAGVVALMKSANKEMKFAEFLKILKETAKKVKLT